MIVLGRDIQNTVCKYELLERIEHNEKGNTIDAGVTAFLNGGMGGFDWKCAYIVKTLKKEYPQIRSELIIPYLTFNPRSTDDFDEIAYPDSFEKYHFKSAIPARNKYMMSPQGRRFLQN